MVHLVLSVGQFQRFMAVIHKLGERVEKEHNQFLRDSQRIEDRSATGDNSLTGPPALGGAVDFESLVGSANGASVKADTVIDSNKSWDDDVWGSIFTSGPEVDGIVKPYFLLISRNSIGPKPFNSTYINSNDTPSPILTRVAKIFES